MATTKLTDTQRVILAAAAARESGLVLPLPTTLGDNSGKLAIVLKSLLARGLITERPILPDEELWRDTAELGRTTLVISADGLRAMGIDPIDHNDEGDGNTIPHGVASSQQGSTEHETNTSSTATTPEGRLTAKKGTKLGALIAALEKSEGATIPDLMEATGWQAHSVRGAMSGNLKKKQNLTIVSEMIEGRGRVYRIGQ